MPENSSELTNNKINQFLNEFLVQKNVSVLRQTKTDPTLFAALFLTDQRTKKEFRPFPYQDIIINDPSPRIVLCIARQSGKSTIAAIKALHHAFYNENSTVIVISKTKPQALEFIHRIKDFKRTSTLGNIWRMTEMTGKESKAEITIRNNNGKTNSRIISIPATDAARGYTADLVICDELAFWENGDYIYNQVVEPMTQFSKGKILVLSTPNGKQGIFWNLFNNPHYSRYQFDWKVCPVNTQEEMDRKRISMTRMQYEAEYEAKFSAPQNAYFNYDEIHKCVDEKIVLGQPGNSLCFGVDFGKINDNSVIFAVRIKNPEDNPKDHVIEVVERIAVPLGTNYASVVQEILAHSKKHSGSRFYLDSTGVGEAPCETLRLNNVFMEPIKFSNTSKMDILGNLKLLIEQGRLRIPNERELIDQLELFEYEYTTGGSLQLHAPAGSHDDEVMALGLACWGFAQSFPVTLNIV